MRNEMNLKGEIKVKVYKDGKLFSTFSEHNIIVNSALFNTVKLIAGDSGASYITKLGVGTNGNPPSYTDADLQDKYIRGLVGYVLENDQKSVTFNFVLDTDEANGKTLREIGLFCENEILFSRRVFPNPIEKTVNIALEGTWTITLNQGE